MRELLNAVNWVDILALILLIRITYVSSRIGVGKQILPLLLLVLILVMPLYHYAGIAAFFTERFSLRPSVCEFLTYAVMTFSFFTIYHIISRITGFCLFSGDTAEPGGIEKVGGGIVGLLRATLIIGIFTICLLLVPVKYVETSVKRSYSGSFFISTNLRVYTSVAKLIFKSNEVSYRQTKEKLLTKKGGYLFDAEGVRERSKFYKEDY